MNFSLNISKRTVVFRFYATFANYAHYNHIQLYLIANFWMIVFLYLFDSIIL